MVKKIEVFFDTILQNFKWSQILFFIPFLFLQIHVLGGVTTMYSVGKFQCFLMGTMLTVQDTGKQVRCS